LETIKDDIKTDYSSSYKKLVVQWLNEALYFISGSVLAEIIVLRNYQLLKHTKCYRGFLN